MILGMAMIGAILLAAGVALGTIATPEKLGNFLLGYGVICGVVIAGRWIWQRWRRNDEATHSRQ